MPLGGKAFIKPLPFGFGTNTAMIDYGVVTAQLAACQSYGMKYVRDNVPWNFTQGSFTGIEVVPGTFSSVNAATVASVVATYKTYGLTPILVVTVNSNPGLTATWTSGIPTTPAQFAAMMAWLVAQPGLQGITWELFNEPDSSGVGVPYALLAQAYSLAYPAMKSADPTCTVMGFVLEGMGPTGYGNETYYNNAVAAGILPYMDQASFHIYCLSSNNTTYDWSPAAYGGDNSPWPNWLTIANWQANRIAKGDTTHMWITEFGWNSSNDGIMTPQLQAQYYQDFMTSISGMDPVNGVLFSSYLKVVCQYAIGNGANEWGIYQQPAASVVTELISGH
jgi:hypothetical protein